LLALPSEHNALRYLAGNHDWAVKIWCRGLRPGHDFAWEYPPGAILFAAPPLGCGGSSSYSLRYVLLLLTLDLATLVVLHQLPHGQVAARTWLLLVPLLGPLGITRFDLGTCLLVASAFVVLARCPFTAGALLAAATSVKVWPVALYAAALRHAARRRLLAGALTAGAALGAVFVLSDTWFAFVTTWRYQQHRGLQIESVPATPFVWLHAAGIGRVDYRYGSWQVSAPGAPLVAAASTLILAAGLLALVFVARRRTLLSGADIGVLAAALGMTLTLTNKVLSPQYLLWVIVLLAVAAGLGAEIRTSWLMLTGTATALTGLLYPPLYHDLLTGGVLPTALLTVRNLALVALGVGLIRSALAMPAPPVEEATATGSREKGLR
jgi:hypothetical protein